MSTGVPRGVLDVGISKQIGVSEVDVRGLSPVITISPTNGRGDLTTMAGAPSSPARPFPIVAENLVAVDH